MGVFLIIYNYNQFTPQQLEKMFGYFKNANYTYIYISLLIAVTGYISRAYRWRYTLQHLGYHSPFSTNFMAVCIGYFMNMTIPRSGEVTRALILSKYKNVPFDKGFGTIIAERVVDLIILLFCIATALILQFDTLKTYISENIPVEQLLFYATISGILTIGGILLFIYSKSRWILLIKGKISGLTEGILSVYKMKNKWPFLFHSLYIWFTYVLMFYITIFALPETAGMSFAVVAVTFVVGSLAITFTNSGFGVYPVVIAAILNLYNIPLEAGTAFGWIVWASQIGMVIVLGGLSFILLPLLHKNK